VLASPQSNNIPVKFHPHVRWKRIDWASSGRPVGRTTDGAPRWGDAALGVTGCSERLDAKSVPIRDVPAKRAPIAFLGPAGPVGPCFSHVLVAAMEGRAFIGSVTDTVTTID